MALSGVVTSLNVSSQYSVPAAHAVPPQPNVPGGGSAHVLITAPRTGQYPLQHSLPVVHIDPFVEHVPASVTGVSHGPACRYGRPTQPSPAGHTCPTAHVAPFGRVHEPGATSTAGETSRASPTTAPSAGTTQALQPARAAAASAGDRRVARRGAVHGSGSGLAVPSARIVPREAPATETAASGCAPCSAFGSCRRGGITDAGDVRAGRRRTLTQCLDAAGPPS
ncbi:MAG: hypothetical protein WCJ30_11115 [Deltaproteobacteria bacterium]